MYCRIDQNLTCTLIVFSDLNRVSPNGYVDQVWSTESCNRKPTNPTSYGYIETMKDFVRELSFCVKEFNQFHHSLCNPVGFKDRAIVQFTTVDTQDVAERLLKEFGVKRAYGPVYKRKHSDGKLSVWLISTGEFLERLDRWKREFEME